MDGKITPGGAGGEGVLASFFNSLLSKKATTTPGSPGNPGMRPTNGLNEPMADTNCVRTDAAAELDRLAKSVRKEDQSEC